MQYECVNAWKTFITKETKISVANSLWVQNKTPKISYKFLLVRTIDENSREHRYLILERNYSKVSRRRMLGDFFRLITPEWRVISIQAGRNKYQRYLRYVTKPEAARWERENILFRWLREDILKNERYNRLIRNTKRKPNPKPKPRLRPRRSNRLIRSFMNRFTAEFNRLLKLSTSNFKRFNDYKDLIRLQRATTHFRWTEAELIPNMEQTLTVYRRRSLSL